MICLTFDIEERFHSHLTPEDAPRQWDAGDRIAQVLDLLAARGRRATFFVVSEMAEHYPDMIRRMTSSGHEVGSHSHTHLRADCGERTSMPSIQSAKEGLSTSSGVTLMRRNPSMSPIGRICWDLFPTR